MVSVTERTLKRLLNIFRICSGVSKVVEKEFMFEDICRSDTTEQDTLHAIVQEAMVMPRDTPLQRQNGIEHAMLYVGANTVEQRKRDAQPERVSGPSKDINAPRQ